MIPDDSALHELAVQVGSRLKAGALRVAAVESCTGGYVAKLLTDVAGSSHWFDCGYVTYSNSAKQRDVGVHPQTLLRHGAVSEAVVREMAEGALLRGTADLAISISGVAGPDCIRAGCESRRGGGVGACRRSGWLLRLHAGAALLGANRPLRRCGGCWIAGTGPAIADPDPRAAAPSGRAGTVSRAPSPRCPARRWPSTRYLPSRPTGTASCPGPARARPCP